GRLDQAALVDGLLVDEAAAGTEAGGKDGDDQVAHRWPGRGGHGAMIHSPRRRDRTTAAGAAIANERESHGNQRAAQGRTEGHASAHAHPAAARAGDLAPPY